MGVGSAVQAGVGVEWVGASGVGEGYSLGGGGVDTS